jgi:FKBP-type peptidyl-prolyl cis-trans isomerase
VIYLNLVLAGLRLGLKNRQVGEKWVLVIIHIYAKVSKNNDIN